MLTKRVYNSAVKLVNMITNLHLRLLEMICFVHDRSFAKPAID